MATKSHGVFLKDTRSKGLSLHTLVSKGQQGLILTKPCNNLLSPALLPPKRASGRESCLGWTKHVVNTRLSNVLKEGETYNFRWSEKLWSPVSPVAHLPSPLRGCPLLSALSQVVLVCCSWFCYVPPHTLPRKITSTHHYFFLHVERDWYKQSLVQILAVISESHVGLPWSLREQDAEVLPHFTTSTGALFSGKRECPWLCYPCTCVYPHCD